MFPICWGTRRIICSHFRITSISTITGQRYFRPEMRCGSGWTGRRVFRLRIPTWKNTIWRKLWDEHTKHEFATPDVDATLATRTVGDNRLVDEMVISFTHTIEMPWMLPNVKPTGRYVEV